MSGKDLSMPKMQNLDTSYVAEAQIVFPSKHLAPINSISTSNNEEYLLSADEGQILLWNFDKPDHPFLVVNTVPKGAADEQR
jgi:serine/threonine-protein phosphatase 2A regulatory subunit B